MLKYVLVAAASLALSASAAEAACSTSALAGKWSVTLEPGWCTISVSSSGKVSGTCFGESASGSLSLTSACKLAGKIAGYSVTGRTDTGVNMFITKIGSAGSLGFRQ